MKGSSMIIFVLMLVIIQNVLSFPISISDFEPGILGEWDILSIHDNNNEFYARKSHCSSLSLSMQDNHTIKFSLKLMNQGKAEFFTQNYNYDVYDPRALVYIEDEGKFNPNLDMIMYGPFRDILILLQRNQDKMLVMSRSTLFNSKQLVEFLELFDIIQLKKGHFLNNMVSIPSCRPFSRNIVPIETSFDLQGDWFIAETILKNHDKDDNEETCRKISISRDENTSKFKIGSDTMNCYDLFESLHISKNPFSNHESSLLKCPSLDFYQDEDHNTILRFKSGASWLILNIAYIDDNSMIIYHESEKLVTPQLYTRSAGATQVNLENFAESLSTFNYKFSQNDVFIFENKC